MKARYASFAASFLLVLGVFAAIAVLVRSAAGPQPAGATTATATATPASLAACSNGTAVPSPADNPGLPTPDPICVEIPWEC